jgi:hypothetical protein
MTVGQETTFTLSFEPESCTSSAPKVAECDIEDST